jgi:hypothetical protein
VSDYNPTAHLTGHHLKKQSQFAPALMGANSFLTKGYEHKPRRGTVRNKAKQSHFEHPVSKEAAGMRGCRESSRGVGRRKTLKMQKA